MIQFSSIDSVFELQNPTLYKNWLAEVIRSEEKISGEIHYIFCSDSYLLDINNKYLDHDYFTDVISFSTTSKSMIVSGEIYISVDRIKDNAKFHKCSFEHELSRVMVHGLLHLIGYNDQSTEEKSLMTRKEDIYIDLQPQRIS